MFREPEIARWLSLSPPFHFALCIFSPICQYCGGVGRFHCNCCNVAVTRAYRSSVWPLRGFASALGLRATSLITYCPFALLSKQRAPVAEKKMSHSPAPENWRPKAGRHNVQPGSSLLQTLGVRDSPDAVDDFYSFKCKYAMLHPRAYYTCVLSLRLSPVLCAVLQISSNLVQTTRLDRGRSDSCNINRMGRLHLRWSVRMLRCVFVCVLICKCTHVLSGTE